jgi:hypothetical protein
VVGDQARDLGDDGVDAALPAGDDLADRLGDGEGGVVAEGVEGRRGGGDAADLVALEDAIAGAEVVDHGRAPAVAEEARELVAVDDVLGVEDEQAVVRRERRPVELAGGDDAALAELLPGEVDQALGALPAAVARLERLGAGRPRQDHERDDGDERDGGGEPVAQALRRAGHARRDPSTEPRPASAPRPRRRSPRKEPWRRAASGVTEHASAAMNRAPRGVLKILTRACQLLDSFLK